MDDRRAELALDVVADDRDALLAKLPAPFRMRGDEDRDAVDQRDACVEAGLCVVVSGILGTDRKIADQNLRTGAA